MDYDESLRALYSAFNARDIDAVLRFMCADVDWPNAWEGGRINGRERVREYWLRQWSAIAPTVDPAAIGVRGDGRVAVVVNQTVRDLDGTLLSESRVVHVYVFRAGLVARMDVQESSTAD